MVYRYGQFPIIAQKFSSLTKLPPVPAAFCTSLFIQLAFHTFSAFAILLTSLSMTCYIYYYISALEYGAMQKSPELIRKYMRRYI